MFELLHAIASLALPAARTRLKLAVRGGIVRLTGDELCVGMGFFGSRDVRRVPLAAIIDIRADVGPAPADGVTLHLSTADDELAIAGLSPLSARRLRLMLRVVQRPS